MRIDLNDDESAPRQQQMPKVAMAKVKSIYCNGTDAII